MNEPLLPGTGFRHVGLASGRWWELELVEQLAHVGSEVERALTWAAKNRPDLSRNALERALELLDLSLADPEHRAHKGRLKELTRLREVLLDYFVGGNEFGCSEADWRSYFGAFAMAAALRRSPRSAAEGAPQTTVD
jgi:hypothetical protein